MASAVASADGRYDVLAAACPTRQIVGRIGDKWSLLVLYALDGGTLRFQELRRTVDGISQRMLTQTLRGLERDGLVERTVHAVIPPHVDYCLTPLGRSLSAHIAGLRAWAYAHIGAVDGARAAFDRRAGQPATTALEQE